MLSNDRLLQLTHGNYGSQAIAVVGEFETHFQLVHQAAV